MFKRKKDRVKTYGGSSYVECNQNLPRRELKQSSNKKCDKGGKNV